jgi:hypothetical protein
MSGASAVHAAGDGAVVARAAAEWLSLAAAPSFATMALMTAGLGGGMDPLCSEMQHGSIMSGMVPMYLMMGALHSAPWLRLIAGRRSSRCHSRQTEGLIGNPAFSNDG